MKDKHGKDITIGSTVKHADGTTSRVSGVIKTTSTVIAKAADVEVVVHPVGAVNTRAAADGDAIIWGT